MAGRYGDTYDPQALYQNLPDEENLSTIHFTVWGGGNWNDQADSLVGRAYQPTPTGFAQQYPVELSDMRNLDFDIQGIKKRLGSAVLDDVTTALQAGDTILEEVEFVNAAGTRCRVAVGTQGLYTNQSGAWAQLIRSSGVTFTSQSAIAKVSFVQADGKLWIMMDGAKNPIQVYRTGTSLDDHAYNTTVTTTYNGTGTLTSTATMSVASISGFNVGDRFLAGTVPLYVGGFGTGTSIIAVAAPGSGSPITSGAVVATANQYTNVYSGSKSTFTGVWGLGYYLGFMLHNRICFGIGDTVWEYCNVNAAYDRALGGFYQAQGRIVAAGTFANRYGDTLREFGILSTTGGVNYIQGFDATDTVMQLEGIGSAINYRGMKQSNDWMVMLTKQRAIMGFNLQQVVNLGRRYRSPDGTGPLDTMNLAQTETLGWAFFNQTKKQVMFGIVDGTNTTVSNILVLDFQLGEPVAGEYLTSFEHRVRLLDWSQTAPWYVAVFRYFGGWAGVMSTGKSYTMDSGPDDFGSGNTAVNAYGVSPEITCGTPMLNKQFRHMAGFSKSYGDWSVNVTLYVNRSPFTTGPGWSWQQILGGSAAYDTSTYDNAVYIDSGVARGHDWIDLYATSLRFQFANSVLGQAFTITDMELAWDIGARAD